MSIYEQDPGLRRSTSTWKTAFTSLQKNYDVVFLSCLVFCVEFSLFKLLQYTTDYLSALAIISYALVGLGIGGGLAYWTPSKSSVVLTRVLGASWFFLAFSIWKILRMPSSGPDCLLISSAFIPAGLYLTKAFSTRTVNETYLADLVGAASATVLTFFALPWFSTEGFLSSLLLAIAILGFFICTKTHKKLWLKGFFILLAILSACLFYLTVHTLEWSPFYLTKRTPRQDIYKSFNRHPGYKLLKKYDNLVSRIEVFQGKGKDLRPIAFDGVGNDAFNTALPETFSRDARFVWGLFESPQIFIIGPSAQGVVKTAKLITSPDRISGLEINPAIYRIMTKDFADFSRFPYSGTKIAVGNALHHLKHSKEFFDIITLINVHSTPRISIPGPPDVMHSIESYQTYFRRLSDRGYLMIEERPDTAPAHKAIAREIATLCEALKRSGASDPAAHFFIYSWSYLSGKKFIKSTYNSYIGILVKKTPLTSSDTKAILDWYSIRIKSPIAQGMPTAETIRSSEKLSHFRINYLKSFIETREYQQLFKSIKQKTLSQDYPQWDMRVVNQDNPYLPYVERNNFAIFGKFSGVFISIMLLVIGVFSLLILHRRDTSCLLHGSYQILIGIAYLTIETLFLQFYQEAFYSPAVSFVIVLTTLLMASAIGGYTIKRSLSPARVLLGLFISLAVHLCLKTQWLDMIAFKALKTLAIITATGLSGFLMGYFLPFGLQIAREDGYDDKSIGTLFAINSLAGATAPALVLYLSSTFSLSFSLWTAAILYSAASWLAQHLAQKTEGLKHLPGKSLCVPALGIALLMATISSTSLLHEKRTDGASLEEQTDEEESVAALGEDRKTPSPQATRIKTIKAPSINHPKSVLLSPNGKLAYIQNLYAHNVTVIDTTSYAILKVIPLEGRACEAAITKNGKHLWVSLAALEDDKGTYPPYIPEPTPGWEKYDFPSVVKVIDTTIDFGTVIATVPVQVKPKILGLSPDETKILASNFNSGTVSIIDTQTYQVIKTLKVGALPRGICFLENGQTAYIANMGSHDISAIDMKKLEVIRTIPVKAIPRHLIASPDGTPVIFGTSANKKGKFFKLDPVTGSEKASVSTDSVPRTFVLTKDGEIAFVGNYRSASVSVIDTKTMKKIGRIRTPKLPIGVALSPDNKRLWVTSFKESSVTVYDVARYLKKTSSSIKN